MESRFRKRILLTDDEPAEEETRAEEVQIKDRQENKRNYSVMRPNAVWNVQKRTFGADATIAGLKDQIKILEDKISSYASYCREVREMYMHFTHEIRNMVTTLQPSLMLREATNTPILKASIEADEDFYQVDAYLMKITGGRNRDIPSQYIDDMIDWKKSLVHYMGLIRDILKSENEKRMDYYRSKSSSTNEDEALGLIKLLEANVSHLEQLMISREEHSRNLEYTLRRILEDDLRNKQKCCYLESRLNEIQEAHARCGIKKPRVSKEDELILQSQLVNEDLATSLEASIRAHLGSFQTDSNVLYRAFQKIRQENAEMAQKIVRLEANIKMKTVENSEVVKRSPIYFSLVDKFKTLKLRADSWTKDMKYISSETHVKLYLTTLSMENLQSNRRALTADFVEKLEISSKVAAVERENFHKSLMEAEKRAIQTYTGRIGDSCDGLLKRIIDPFKNPAEQVKSVIDNHAKFYNESVAKFMSIAKESSSKYESARSRFMYMQELMKDRLQSWSDDVKKSKDPLSNENVLEKLSEFSSLCESNILLYNSESQESLVERVGTLENQLEELKSQLFFKNLTHSMQESFFEEMMSKNRAMEENIPKLLTSLSAYESELSRNALERVKDRNMISALKRKGDDLEKILVSKSNENMLLKELASKQDNEIENLRKQLEIMDGFKIRYKSDIREIRMLLEEGLERWRESEIKARRLSSCDYAHRQLTAALAAEKEENILAKEKITELKEIVIDMAKSVDLMRKEDSTTKELEYYRGYHLCKQCRRNMRDAVLIGCGHSFCHECADRVTEPRVSACPVCRAPVNKKSIQPIIL